MLPTGPSAQLNSCALVHTQYQQHFLQDQQQFTLTGAFRGGGYMPYAEEDVCTTAIHSDRRV